MTAQAGQSDIEVGSRWVNKHTGAEANVLTVGPASDFGGEVRVHTSADLPGGSNNGWSVEMWLAHCISCERGEQGEDVCPDSPRPCHHHCNHSWSHELCCYCGREWGEAE